MATLLPTAARSGDVLVYEEPAGTERVVRLLGIEAPVLRSTYEGELALATDAAEFLADIVIGRALTITADCGLTAAGERLLAVSNDTGDVSTQIVAAGCARCRAPEMTTDLDPMLLLAEDRAVALGAGIWANAHWIAVRTHLESINARAWVLLNRPADPTALPQVRATDYMGLASPVAGATDASVRVAVVMSADILLDAAAPADIRDIRSPIAVYEDIAEGTPGSTRASGRWYQNAANRRITIVFSAPLAELTWHRIHVRGVNALAAPNAVTGRRTYPARDLDGASYDLEFSFRTAAAPLAGGSDAGHPAGWTAVTMTSDPADGTIFVDEQAIAITFDHLIGEDIALTDYISVKKRDVLDDVYVAADVVDESHLELGDWEIALSLEIAAGMGGGGTSTITLAVPEDSWADNAEYTVTILPDIPFTDGWYDGGSVRWIGHYSPFLATPTMVRMDAGSPATRVTTESLATYILRASIAAVNRGIANASLSDVSEWVSVTTAMNVLNTLRIATETTGTGGARLKSIGSLSFDYPQEKSAIEIQWANVMTLREREKFLAHRIWRLKPTPFIPAAYDPRRPVYTRSSPAWMISSRTWSDLDSAALLGEDP